FGEFGAEQEDLGGIVDPQQDDDQRPGRAIGRGDLAAADVKTDQPLAHREQQGGYDGAHGDVPPRDLRIRQEFVDGGEEQGDEHERDDEIADIEQEADGRQDAVQIGTQRGQGGARGERDHQEEAERQDEAEADEARADQPRDGGIVRLRLPDGVERGLHLDEDAARREQQGDEADDRRDGAGTAVAGALQHVLQGLGALLAHQPAQLVDDGALRRRLAEGEPGDGDGDEQHRRDRKNRVIGDRRAMAERAVVDEGGDALSDQPRDLANHSGCSRIRPRRGQFGNVDAIRLFRAAFTDGRNGLSGVRAWRD